MKEARVKIGILSELLAANGTVEMSKRIPCPPPSLLSALSEDGLDDEIRQALLDHVKQCEPCTDLYERLSAFSQFEGKANLRHEEEQAWSQAEPRLRSAVRKMATPGIPEKKRFLNFAFLPAPAKWALSFCGALLIVGVSLLFYQSHGAGDSTGMAGNSSAPSGTHSTPSTSATQAPSVELANAEQDQNTSLTAQSSEPLSDKNAASPPEMDSGSSVKQLPSTEYAAATDGVLLEGSVVHLTFDSVSSRLDSAFLVTGELSASGVSSARFHANLNPRAEKNFLEISQFSLNGSEISLDPPRAVAVTVISENPGASIQSGGTLDVLILKSVSLQLPR